MEATDFKLGRYVMVADCLDHAGPRKDARVRAVATGPHTVLRIALPGVAVPVRVGDVVAPPTVPKSPPTDRWGAERSSGLVSMQLRRRSRAITIGCAAFACAGPVRRFVWVLAKAVLLIESRKAPCYGCAGEDTLVQPLVEQHINFGVKAPIAEALIDIRVDPAPNLDLQDLKGFAEAFPDRFPKSRMQTRFESQFQLRPGGQEPSMTAQHAIDGFVFFSPDDMRVVQARRDGFAFSKLRPYESWPQLRAEAQELWKHYCMEVSPGRVTRLAVRYINHINLPAGQVPLEDWFNLHPKTPEPLGPMDEFLVRVAVTHPARPQYRAVVTQATQPSPSGAAMVVLDIDVFTEVDFAANDVALWNVLDELRVFKNDVFFGTITKKTERSLL